MVNTGKTIKKALACILSVMMLLSMAVIPASAGGMIGDLEMDISQMNELTARAAVNAYFSQRFAFLSGSADEITVVNEGMMADEIVHKAYLDDQNIIVQSSNATITSITCWDNMAIVAVTENVQFLMNGNNIAETILHKVSLCCLSSTKVIVVQSDAYTEISTNFSSCSYISPEALQAYTIAATAGSGSCMSYTAYKEVGEAEDPNTHISKYGQWVADRDNLPGIADDAWCAMFVLWCAYHANVSYGIIPYYYGVQNMRNALYQMGNYQSTYSSDIQPGDLIFFNGTSASPEHIGIVYAVSGSVINVIDGNQGDQVAQRTLRLSDSSIVGYGTPNYISANHSFSGQYCSVCGYRNSSQG